MSQTVTTAVEKLSQQAKQAHFKVELGSEAYDEFCKENNRDTNFCSHIFLWGMVHRNDKFSPRGAVVTITPIGAIFPPPPKKYDLTVRFDTDTQASEFSAFLRRLKGDHGFTSIEIKEVAA